MNDPVNNLDLLGLFAYAERNGNNLNIIIPIIFNGPGATKSVINKFTTAIEKKWTGTFGKFNVTTKVVNPSDVPGSEINYVYIPKGNGKAHVFINQFGCIQAQRPGGTAAHEGGHFMFLRDKYDKKTGKPLPGYKNNIMGNINGVPFEEDIENILILNEPLNKKAFR